MLISDSASEFSKHVVELYTKVETWNSLSEASLKSVARFSPQSVKTELVNIFEKNNSMKSSQHHASKKETSTEVVVVDGVSKTFPLGKAKLISALGEVTGKKMYQTIFKR